MKYLILIALLCIAGCYRPQKYYGQTVIMPNGRIGRCIAARPGFTRNDVGVIVEYTTDTGEIQHRFFYESELRK